METTNVIKINLQIAVKERIQVTGNLTEVARSLGISPAQLMNVRDGNWDKVSKTMINTLAAKLGVKKDWVTAETADYRRIVGICMHSQKKGLSKAIAFDPGCGKTYALKDYASKSPNVYYIECDEYWTKKVFLEQLRKAMGLTEPGLSVHQMVMEIVECLNAKDLPLVIIDEADKLKDGVLNFYKTLYNKTNCGFVLCGAPFFQKHILKGVRLQKQAFQEIYSRMGSEFLPLSGVTPKAIKLICQVNEVGDEESIARVINASKNDLRRVKSEIEQIKTERLTNAA
jgi:DNA transposition AAA+ family ATPase